MTRVADEAGKVIHELLLARNVPQQIKDHIRNRLSTLSAREQTLRNAINVLRDSGQSQANRLAALDIVIDFFKGDR